MKNSKIKVSFLVDSSFIPVWQKDIIDFISNDDRFELNSFLMPGVINSTDRKLDSGHGKLVFRIYRWLDRKVFGSDTFEHVKLNNNVDILRLDYTQKGLKDIFDTKSVEAIKTRNIDVIIRLGFRILSGEVLNSCKYGIWSFHHANNRLNRGGPPGFWEIKNGEYATGATLQVLRESLDGGGVINRSLVSTCFYSLVKNKENAVLSGNAVLFSELIKLYETREINLVSGLDIYDRYIYKYPCNSDFILFMIRIFSGLINLILKKYFYRDEWYVGYSHNNGNKMINLSRMKTIPNEKGFFKADPFLIKINSLNWIFYEKCELNKGKGWIEAYCIESGEVHEILKEKWHLSYPNIWCEDGHIYLMPQSDNNEINVYKCRNFPSDWALVNTLVSHERLKFGDPTFSKDNNGKYNLRFTAYSSNQHANDALYNVYLDDLIKDKFDFDLDTKLLMVDAMRARPAGNNLTINNEEYIVSQNCTKEYGKSIIVLDTSFEVKEEIEANFIKGLSGIHTVNRNDDYICIDFKKKKWFLY